MTTKPLTPLQRTTLDYIVDCQAAGWTPTYREIGDHLNADLGSVQCLLRAVEARGYIECFVGMARMIRVLDTGRAETIWGVFSIGA